MAEINKSILVIDTPLRCYDCPSYKGSIRGDMCGVAGNTLTTSELFNNIKKPNWCPLKPVLEKHKELSIEEYEFGKLGLAFTQGWNSCIDEILGETE